MTPVQKWDVFFKFISVLVAVGAGWFTISRWYLAKILEYEVECLKNIATITAHWNFLRSGAESREDQNAIKNIQIVVEDFDAKEELITSSNLPFKDLREYNKRLHSHAAYVVPERKELSI